MGSSHIIMRRDTDNACIIFYPEHVWQAKVSELRNELDEWNPEDQMILMQFMSEAEILDMDTQGRVLLQKKHLEMIGAEQDIVFVGMLDRIAVWNPEVFADKQMPNQDLAALIRQRMKKQMPKT
jgi:MraZ protein